MTLTATAEPETAAPPALAERPVFAASTPARPRALRLAGRATAGLVALWLVALVLGTFGFGPVAGIGLPRIGGGGADPKPQREAAHRTSAPQPSQHLTRNGVTLTAKQRGRAARRAQARSGNASASRRPAATPGTPSSWHRGGSRGSQPSHSPGASGGRSGATAQTPAGGSAPASTAAPGGTSSGTSQTATHGNSTHSQATPQGSSSTAPGSRSNAGSAPGRDHSSASPSPGSGRDGHTPPTG